VSSTLKVPRFCCKSSPLLKLCCTPLCGVRSALTSSPQTCNFVGPQLSRGGSTTPCWPYPGYTLWSPGLSVKTAPTIWSNWAVTRINVWNLLIVSLVALARGSTSRLVNGAKRPDFWQSLPVPWTNAAKRVLRKLTLANTFQWTLGFHAPTVSFPVVGGFNGRTRLESEKHKLN